MNATTKIVILVSLLLLAACGSEKKNTQAENAIPDPIVSNGVKISYNVYGDGSYTLLFVHGWCINQTYWSEQIEPLKADYIIVTIDLPGFGQSGKSREDWSIETYGNDINNVIEQLQLTNVILIGHSMGGDVILEAAVKNEEVVALIGIDNFKDVGIELTDEMEAEIQQFVSMLKRNYSEIATSYAEGTLFHPSTDSADKRRVMEDIKNSDSLVAISTLEALLAYMGKETAQLSKLKQKIYLINSDATPTNRNGLDETGVSYEVLDIHATGHYPMIEKPDEFNRLLRETLQKIEQLQ